MENTKGGVIIGTISLAENFLKAVLSITVLMIGIPYVFVAKGIKKCVKKHHLSLVKVILDKIHADIYVLLSIFGFFCSVLLIIGALTKSSGKVIWWICFQGVSIFHQIFFSADIVYALYQRVVSDYIITICVLTGIVLLIYVILEIHFMYYIVQLYQKIVESEIELAMHRSVVINPSPMPHARESSTQIRERTDRNNPMQSSIIKLLTELEGNNTSDTVPLIK